MIAAYGKNHYNITTNFLQRAGGCSSVRLHFAVVGSSVYPPKGRFIPFLQSKIHSIKRQGGRFLWCFYGASSNSRDRQ